MGIVESAMGILADGMRSEPFLVSPAEYKRLNAAIEIILRWEPDWRPGGGGPSEIYFKLEKMGLLNEFLKTYNAAK